MMMVLKVRASGSTPCIHLHLSILINANDTLQKHQLCAVESCLCDPSIHTMLIMVGECTADSSKAGNNC